MTGYVRKDTTNNIADGNVINAADLDAEFDGVQDAFNASTGHKHDGTAGEGATINALGPTQDVTISSTLLAPKTTNTVDIGSSSLKFKDLFLAGNGSVGGTLAVTGVATFTAQPIVSSLTASRAVFSDGSKGLVSNAITGTGNVVMSASPTLTGTIAAEALTASSSVTLSGGTANGVAYLNGSKVLTSGSALTFDGTTFKVAKAGGVFGPTNLVYVDVTSSYGGVTLNSASGQNCFFELYQGGTTKVGEFGIDAANSLVNIGGFGSYNTRFYASGSEQMRLTSTGLGIGTSSPGSKLDVTATSAGNYAARIFNNSATGYGIKIRNGNDSNDALRISNAADTADNIALYGSGNAYFAGNVGIGTSSPSKKLEVNSGSAIAVRLTRSGGIVANLSQEWFDGTNSWYAGVSGSSFFGIAYNSSGGAIDSALLRLDTSGNLGLGVTPSAWYAGYRAIEMPALSFFSGAGGGGLIYGNGYLNSSAVDTYKITGQAATKYNNQGGQHAWYVAPSGTAGTAISFTQAMTLDASGNLAIGSTSVPNASQNILYARRDQQTSTVMRVDNQSTTTNSAEAVVSAIAYNSGINIGAVGSNVTGYGLPTIAGLAPAGVGYLMSFASYPMAINQYYAQPIVFGTNNTERARIDSSGNLLVGKTALGDTSVGCQITPAGGISMTLSASTNATVTNAVYSTGASAYRFYVGMGGTVYATSTTITAISDQRLKENIRDLDDGLNVVMALKPRKFDWKAGKGQDIKNARGFIAQEFETVLPDMIEEWRDPAPEGEEAYKAINANLIPTLVKAIQELKAEFDAYKASHP